MKILTALIVQDTLREALRQGSRYVVRIDGKPDGERTTFKAAQALARQRGATEFVITASSYEIKPTATRHSLMHCNRTFFEDGGRTETTCKNTAEYVCSGPDCENVRCHQCDDLGFDEVNGVTLCEECQTARFTVCAGWDFERIDAKKNLLKLCGLSEDFATSGWIDIPADVQQKILYAPIADEDGQQ